jgi:Holliday junction resolvase
LKRITVVKESGEKEDYNPSKVKDALRRAGLSGKSADAVIARLERRLYDGITTKKIYQTVYEFLDELKPEVSHKYNLKRALLEMGPAGYVFEDFTSKLLALEGYRTEVRQVLQGKCVTHEIDVIAAKNDETYLIECKFHNQAGLRCSIQTALYMYARYLDISEGAKLGLCRKFTRPWLVTNTKFSDDVVKYADCMGIPLLGWRQPLDNSLELRIDRTKCYPITVIPMSADIRGRLLGRKIITVFDIPESAEKLVEMVGISMPRAKEIVERAEYAR